MIAQYLNGLIERVQLGNSETASEVSKCVFAVHSIATACTASHPTYAQLSGSGWMPINATAARASHRTGRRAAQRSSRRASHACMGPSRSIDRAHDFPTYVQ